MTGLQEARPKEVPRTAVRMANVVLFSTVLILLICACSRMRDLVASANPYFTPSYKDVCEKWSREARIHRGLEVKLIASATYKSDEFREAYVEEYAQAYRLSQKEKIRLTDELQQRVRDRYEFVMATFVPEKKWDKFDKDPSIWKLYLVDEKNARVAPLEVIRLDSKDGIADHFFPYVTPWKSVYAITFPAFVQGTKKPILDSETKTLQLVITSVQGTAKMTWTLR